jgi:protein-tyrosine-phosphatase
MPTTLPGISVTQASRLLQIQDRILKSFPEVERVFGKLGRAETPTDPAAEVILNSLGKGKFNAFSAGSHPTGTVNSFALELIEKNRSPTSGLRSKDWNEFSRPGAPFMHFVFTVCDQAAAEPCPVWPGQPMTAHWGVQDPAAVTGGRAARSREYGRRLAGEFYRDGCKSLCFDCYPRTCVRGAFQSGRLGGECIGRTALGMALRRLRAGAD